MLSTDNNEFYDLEGGFMGGWGHAKSLTLLVACGSEGEVRSPSHAEALYDQAHGALVDGERLSGHTCYMM